MGYRDQGEAVRARIERLERELVEVGRRLEEHAAVDPRPSPSSSAPELAARLTGMTLGALHRLAEAASLRETKPQLPPAPPKREPGIPGRRPTPPPVPAVVHFRLGERTAPPSPPSAPLPPSDDRIDDLLSEIGELVSEIEEQAAPVTTTSSATPPPISAAAVTPPPDPIADRMSYAELRAELEQARALLREIERRATA